MPHKKAKRSIRDQLRSHKGTDHPPTSTLSSEPIPKSLSRVLDAVKIRGEWKEKKRKWPEEGGGNEERKEKKRRTNNGKVGTEKDKVLGIKPGESLGHFNKRVEQDMKPLVKSAIQSSAATSRQTKKAELAERAQKLVSKKGGSRPQQPPPPSPPPNSSLKHADRPKEFQGISSSVPRRLNDIAQAPPEFTKLPRGLGDSVVGKKGMIVGGKGGKNASILSMAQKFMMEEEREKAIVRYRQMKERGKVKDGDG